MASISSSVARSLLSGMTRQNLSSCSFPKRHIHITYNLKKSRRAGEYKITINRTKPLTYEQSMKPTDIAYRKGYNSANTAQLEGTFLEREQIGQDLPHKTFVEDMFIRKFINGTFPEATLSEVIIKRQHNFVRIATIISRTRLNAAKVYFLIGYSEELLSYWLKCPVKLELQSAESDKELVYKYI